MKQNANGGEFELKSLFLLEYFVCMHVICVYQWLPMICFSVFLHLVAFVYIWFLNLINSDILINL